MAPEGAPATSAVTPTACIGDCDRDGQVTVAEIIKLLKCALRVTPVELPCDCADVERDGGIRVADIVIAVNNALIGCS
jgi:hypothetical protein